MIYELDVIDEFKGKHYFLSNFYSAPVMYQGITYQNNEAAFQAMKITDKSIHLEFSELPPNLAKRKGRRVKLRPEWEEVKETFMYEIVKAKFEQNAHLKNKLLQTGESILIEGNTWGDKIWGVCDGVGENKLGKILMKVRNELKRGTVETDQSI